VCVCVWEDVCVYIYAEMRREWVCREKGCVCAGQMLTWSC